MPHKFDTIVNASVSMSERETAKRLIIISSKTLVVVSKHNRESLSDSGVERERQPNHWQEKFNIPPSPSPKIRSRRVDTTPPQLRTKKIVGPASWVFPLFSIVVKMSFKYLTLTLTPLRNVDCHTRTLSSASTTYLSFSLSLSLSLGQP